MGILSTPLVSCIRRRVPGLRYCRSPQGRFQGQRRRTAASAVDLHGFLGGLGPMFTGSLATGISDTGSIVGYAFYTSGNTYAVLWTPVPEPTTCALIVVGIGVASLARERRRHRTWHESVMAMVLVLALAA